MSETIEVRCIVAAECFWDGKLRQPGSDCWYSGDADKMPGHLIPADEVPGAPVNHPDQEVKVDEDHLPPSQRSGAAETAKLSERQEELLAACEMLDKDDSDVWTKASKSPKLPAVNAVLLKSGSDPATPAELHSLGFRRPK